MRSNIAALRTLVLPFGQTSGRRIVLDGVNGLIQVFDADDVLILEIGQPDGVRLHTGDPAEGGAGLIGAQVNGAGGTRVMSIGLDSPQFDPPGAFSEIFLDSASFDQSIPSTISYRAKLHEFTDAGFGEGTPDITLDGQSLGRGVIAYQRLTANDAARAAGVNTDMALTFTADDTRLYEVTFKGEFNYGATSATMVMDLSEGGTVGGADGTSVDRLWRMNPSETGSQTGARTATVLYRPTAGAKTIRLKNNAGSTQSLTLIGAAGRERQFWIKDIGAR